MPAAAGHRDDEPWGDGGGGLGDGGLGGGGLGAGEAAPPPREDVSGGRTAADEYSCRHERTAAASGQPQRAGSEKNTDRTSY